MKIIILENFFFIFFLRFSIECRYFGARSLWFMVYLNISLPFLLFLVCVSIRETLVLCLVSPCETLSLFDSWRVTLFLCEEKGRKRTVLYTQTCETNQNTQNLTILCV